MRHVGVADRRIARWRSHSVRRWRHVAAVAATGLLLAGCGTDPTPVPEPEVTEAEPADPPPPQPCDNQRQSYRPGGSVDSLRTAALAELRDDKRLVVGTAADNYLMASRNPFSGQVEGFDIDLARLVAQALWPGGNPDTHIQLRVITAADRIPVLEDEEVDLVARNMTANCERWQQVAFSAIYYEAGQKLLVRRGEESRIRGLKDLGGKRVCVPGATTSQAQIEAGAPDAEVVPVAQTSGCLVLFQRGEVEVITGDDTVLAGIAAQDPYAFVTKTEAFSEEPYGLAMNKNDTDLVRFVNAVLEQAVSDGSWQRSYDKWLAPTLGDSRPPEPEYGR